ncbi:MAG: hypothetical protein ACKVW3_01720 [Phycisphaerales bacterium]
MEDAENARLTAERDEARAQVAVLYGRLKANHDDVLQGNGACACMGGSNIKCLDGQALADTSAAADAHDAKVRVAQHERTKAAAVAKADNLDTSRRDTGAAWAAGEISANISALTLEQCGRGEAK